MEVRLVFRSALFLLAALVPSISSAAADERPAQHIVVKGQTLKAIAKRYHLSVDELREANQLAPGHVLAVGARLAIPQPDEPAAREPAMHEVSTRELASRELPAREPTAREPAKRKQEEKSTRSAAEASTTPHVKKGHLRLMRGSEVWEGKLSEGHGKPSPKALAAVSRLARFGPTGKQAPINPRLVTLLGIVSDHFGGRPVRIVSGFRPYSPKQYTPHSRHNAGAALDFQIEGVSNGALSAFCKSFKNVGVGSYPNSSFVHFDVRPVFTTWVDYARPGEPPRYNLKTPPKEVDESASDVGNDEANEMADPGDAGEGG